MTSRYAVELYERGRRHQLQVAFAVCDCGAVWTVSLTGRPLSWLGDWAAERHAGHRVEVRR